MATLRGMHTLGVEPNNKMAEAGITSGLTIRLGFFPNVLDAAELFDVICFHEVLQCIEDVNTTVEQAGAFLNCNGTLVIKHLDSHSLMHRASLLLARIGFVGPLERLWQKPFVAPCLHQFSTKSVVKLCKKFGFEHEVTFRNKNFAINGLWTRLAFDTSSSLIFRVVVFGALLTLYPLFALFPESVVHFFKKAET